jgi:hypothetical protein
MQVDDDRAVTHNHDDQQPSSSKRSREEDSINYIDEPPAKFAKVGAEELVVIEDEMYVYELQCVMHPISQFIEPHYDTVLLFSFYDLQRPFPFCPYDASMIRDINIKEKATFVSPLFLCRVDMNVDDLRTLVEWYRALLDKDRFDYKLVQNIICDSQEISGRFALFPSRDTVGLMKSLKQFKANQHGNYSFNELFQCIEKTLLVLEAPPDSLDTALTDEAQTAGLDSLTNNTLQHYNVERIFSLKFEDCVLYNSEDQQFYISEFISISKDGSKRMVGCRKVNSLEDISVTRSTSILKFFKDDRLISSKTSLPLIDTSVLYPSSFSISVLRIIERIKSIKKFNEQIVSHLKSLQSLEQMIDIRFNDMFLLRESLTHDSFAIYHGNRSIGNERLEYLGDAVLDVVCDHYFYHKYPLNDNAHSAKTTLVTNKSIASLGNAIHLKNYILSMIPINDKMVADAIEAMCGTYINTIIF